jgi:apolipoprotein N-acyltransferase
VSDNLHMKNPFVFFSCVLASILSGILLILSFHHYQVGWLAWVALVPLLLAISGRSMKVGFLLSCFCMMIFFGVVFGFTLQIPAYSILHHAILDVYLGFLCGLFGLGYSYLWRKWGGAVALLGSPFLWVCLEYIRANFGMLAFPWVLLAYSQYENLPLIQVASMTGAYGVSFLIVMVNAGIAAMLLGLMEKIKRNETLIGRRAQIKSVTMVAFTAAVLFALSWGYGKQVLGKPLSGPRVKVSLVQGNIEQRKKWDRRNAAYIMDTYSDLTAKASKEKPDLIIWPETATPRSITLDLSLRKQVLNIARDAGTCILLGSAEHQKFQGSQGKELQFHNSAFLFTPSDMAENQRYEKIHLFPFGEYLPWKKVMPWSVLNVPEVGNYLPGEEYTVFECGDFRFGVTICWEILFPELVRKFVKAGAQTMVNITNEAWFGKTAAPYLVVTGTVFRAVENHVYVARCANTGPSCFIDPYGQIGGKIVDDKGEELFVRGVLTNTVVPMDTKTIYTRFGNWLVWLSLGLSGIFLLAGFLRKSPSDYTALRG